MKTHTIHMTEDEWGMINRVLSRAQKEYVSHLMKPGMRDEYLIGMRLYADAVKKFIEQTTTTK